MEIVVARYNENLYWLQEILERTSDYNLKITIYNKGNSSDVINIIDPSQELNENYPELIGLQQSRVSYIQLPNVGVCDHTYLYHIVTRYTTLSPITLFLPGSAYNDETKRPRLSVLMQSLVYAIKSKPFIEMTSVISIPWIFKSTYVSFSRTKKVDFYECTDIRNRDGNQSIKPSEIRPFGKWYDTHLKPIIGDAQNVTLKGMFMVGKSKLLSRPLSMYTNLLNMVNTHRFPEESHYIERSWHAIINPKSNEEISLLLVVPYIKEIIAIILICITISVFIVLSKMKKPEIHLS